MRINLACCVSMLCIGYAAAGPESAVSWLDTEKVRAAYHYGRPPVRERLERLQRCGFNSIILKCTTERALPWAAAAGEYGIRCFLAFNFNVSAEKGGFRCAVLDTGQTEAYACPLDRRFWHEHLTPALLERAGLAARQDLNVHGLWIDFELYSTKTGQRYYTRACYCDQCFDAFCRHQQVPSPNAAADKRLAWLREQGLDAEYQPFLQARIEQFATELREKVHAVAPNFLLGFYPTPHNWSLIGVARAFATDDVPILLWATDTYSRGGADSIPDDWRELYARQGINARYIAGLLLRCYSARNLAANLYHVAQKCDGYWLFTTYTLNRTPEQHKGDYYLGSGTPDEYWDAITRGNAEIRMRLAEGPAFQSSLVVGPEPLAYPPLTRAELRRRLKRLVPPSEVSIVHSLPEVRLRGANVLVLAARQGRAIDLELAYHQVGIGRAQEPISWRVVDIDGHVLDEGAGERGAGVLFRTTPERDGVLFVIASAQSSCWSVVRCSTPFGLYAGSDLHMMLGAKRLFVRIPDNAERISFFGRGASGRETLRAEWLDAAGRLIAAAESDAKIQEFTLATATKGHGGEIWSVRIAEAQVGILEDHYVRLPEPLPPVFALVPEYVFGTQE